MEEPFAPFSIVTPKQTLVVPSGDAQVMDTFLMPGDEFEVVTCLSDSRVHIDGRKGEFYIRATLLKQL